MPALAPAELSSTLHETNARLRVWLDSLVPAATTPDRSSDLPPRAATPQQMAGLLSELMRAGQCLRTLPGEGEKDAALDRELSEYRANVERLRTLMPSIHSTLLAERARLEQERARVQSAADWASRSRQTL
jgi:hypothetical protein